MTSRFCVRDTEPILANIIAINIILIVFYDFAVSWLSCICFNIALSSFSRSSVDQIREGVEGTVRISRIINKL